MGLTSWGVMLGMGTQRQIWELSEGKSAELNDELEIGGEVRKRGVKYNSGF